MKTLIIQIVAATIGLVIALSIDTGWTWSKEAVFTIGFVAGMFVILIGREAAPEGGNDA